MANRSVCRQYSPMHALRERHITPNATEESKFDGFRALAYVEEGGCRLMSRRRHEYKSFHELCTSIAEHLSGRSAVLDGEIVCLDQVGRSQFKDLPFRRAQPFFYAFDLLWLDGEDLRALPLIAKRSSAYYSVHVGHRDCYTWIISRETGAVCSGRSANST